MQTQIVERAVIKPQRPAKIPSRDIKYITVTKETAGDDISRGQAYMCLSWQDYLTLSQWEQDKLRYIRQANEVIKYYERTLEEDSNSNPAKTE